ncbi:histone-like nucleoid-structuring protein Lsr2 [Streptomyces sp. NPDC012769]|uniref:Lsr2 dimerization domain-containing protein n=1 Tax=Streptomyces sp. NPDC012769 TaxID=3364848 RepID=UPI0036B727D3
MSVRVVQVDESQKDEPGVEKAVTTIGGQSIETYARLERVDDLDGKTTEKVVEIQMLVPVEDEDAESDEPAYIYNRVVLDLGPANLSKYLKAIAPYADKGRIQPQSSAAVTAPPAAGRTTTPEISAWNKRAKEWLRGAGHKVADRGRIPTTLEEIYVKNHPDDPKPE